MLYEELIEKHLDDRSIILTDESGSCTYRQLHERAAKLRGFLKRRLSVGDRVLIPGRNDIRTAAAVLACIAEGFIFVLLHENATTEEREQIEADCTPSICFDGLVSEECAEAPDTRKKLPKETLTYILYTSGTEGEPKGVTAGAGQILFCCRAINERLQNSRQDRILCCLPLAFDYGLYQLFLSLMYGSPLFLVDGKRLQSLPAMLKKMRITAFPTLPSVMNLLMRTSLFKNLKLPKLRYISFTGEVLSSNLLLQLMETFPGTEIVPMYGLTECKRVSVMPFGRTDKKLAGSCGLPLDGVTVWLEEKDPDTGVGELVVSGPNVMEGYWGSLGEDGLVFAKASKDGRLCVRTGDLFRIDKEGFLYFCGRKNGIIKIRGYRASAAQVGKKLERIETLIEYAVFGIDDRYCGEKPAVFVYTEDPEAERKIRSALSGLPEYMQNYCLRLQKTPLLRSGNGKIDVARLKKMMENDG